jgi:glycosyltransferase involved in cell wall biosynthesis
MMSEIEFTVVMAAFNAEETIEEALNSVLAQTDSPTEVLVIDDGSTDRTCEVVQSFSSRGVRLLRMGENRGGGEARNAGIAATRTSHVTFLDADDVLLPHHIAVHRIALQETGADVVATKLVNWDSRTGTVWADDRRVPWVEPWSTALRRSNFLCGASTFRSDLLRELGGYRTGVTEDWDLWIRVVSSRFKVEPSAVVTYMYRWREGSVSRSFSAIERDRETLIRALKESRGFGDRLAVRRGILLIGAREHLAVGKNGTARHSMRQLVVDVLGALVGGRPRLAGALVRQSLTKLDES